MQLCNYLIKVDYSAFEVIFQLYRCICVNQKGETGSRGMKGKPGKSGKKVSNKISIWWYSTTGSIEVKAPFGFFRGFEAWTAQMDFQEVKA